MAQSSAPLSFHGTGHLAYCPPESPMSPWASARGEAGIRSASIPQRALSPNERMRPLTLPVVTNSGMERSMDGAPSPAKQPLWISQSQGSPNLLPAMSPSNATWRPSTLPRRGPEALPHKVLPTGLRHSSLTPLKAQAKVERPTFHLPIHETMSRGVVMMDAKRTMPPIASQQYAPAWPSGRMHHPSHSPPRHMLPVNPAGTVTETRLISSHTKVMPLGTSVMTDARGSYPIPTGRPIYQEPSRSYVSPDTLSTARSPLVSAATAGPPPQPTQSVHQVIGVYNNFMQQQVSLLSNLYERLGELQRSLLHLSKTSIQLPSQSLLPEAADQLPLEDLPAAQPNSHRSADRPSSVEALQEGINQLKQQLTSSAQTIRGRLETVATELSLLKQASSLDSLPVFVRQPVTADGTRSDSARSVPVSQLPTLLPTQAGPLSVPTAGAPPPSSPHPAVPSSPNASQPSVIKLLEGLHASLSESTQSITSQLTTLASSLHASAMDQQTQQLQEAVRQIDGFMTSTLNGRRGVADSQLDSMAATLKESFAKLEGMQCRLVERMDELKHPPQALPIPPVDDASTLKAVDAVCATRGKELAASIEGRVSGHLEMTQQVLLEATEMSSASMQCVVEGVVEAAVNALTAEATQIQKLLRNQMSNEGRTAVILKEIQTSQSNNACQHANNQEQLHADMASLLKPLERSKNAILEGLTAVALPVNQILNLLQAQQSGVSSNLEAVQRRIAEMGQQLTNELKEVQLAMKDGMAAECRPVLQAQKRATGLLQVLLTNQELATQQWQSLEADNKAIKEITADLQLSQESVLARLAVSEDSQQESIQLLKKLLADQKEQRSYLEKQVGPAIAHLPAISESQKVSERQLERLDGRAEELRKAVADVAGSVSLFEKELEDLTDLLMLNSENNREQRAMQTAIGEANRTAITTQDILEEWISDEKRKKDQFIAEVTGSKDLILSSLGRAVEDLIIIVDAVDKKLDKAVVELSGKLTHQQSTEEEADRVVLLERSAALTKLEGLQERANATITILWDLKANWEDTASRIKALEKANETARDLPSLQNAVVRLEGSLNELKETTLAKLTEKSDQEIERNAKVRDLLEALSANFEALMKVPIEQREVRGLEGTPPGLCGDSNEKAEWEESEQWNSDVSHDSWTSTRRQIDLDNLQLRSLLENCVTLTDSLKALADTDKIA